MFDKKQQLINSISYVDFENFRRDYENKTRRDEASLNGIISEYILHKEHRFGVDIDLEMYHELRQRIEFFLSE